MRFGLGSCGGQLFSALLLGIAQVQQVCGVRAPHGPRGPALSRVGFEAFNAPGYRFRQGVLAQVSPLGPFSG